jgi:hypothetical protein
MAGLVIRSMWCELPDGDLTTIENTRVVAANEAGINVQAMIHGSMIPFRRSSLTASPLRKVVCRLPGVTQL